MRKQLLFILSVIAGLLAKSQTVEETWPRTLWCPNDSFAIRYQDDPRRDVYTVSRKDKVSPGTDAAPGMFCTIYYGTDSIRLNYHNHLPYAHIFYIPFESPKGKTVLRFHYNDLACYFNPDYMDAHQGTVQFDIPEVYELANIIWTLSPSGKRATDLYKMSAYYQEVLKWFSPYLNHPVFKNLDIPDSVYSFKYYDFRENSFAFTVSKDPYTKGAMPLQYAGPYYYVYGDQLADSSLFGIQKKQVEDFARVSRFREFYKQHKLFYQQEIQRLQQLLPVKQMWQWLEEQFPGRKYQSYRIVFSPLIGGSHSTQRYSQYYKKAWYTENVMFICGPQRYDEEKELTEKQREGLMSGIVFTEIDHNYVNPVSNKYGGAIDSIFSRRDIWAPAGKSSDFYDSPQSVFNEYMTHAAFCLYIRDSYDKATADLVIERREEMMVERRNFIRFRAFDQALFKIRAEHPGMTLKELFPFVLSWCREQQ